jgi:hypothetical protein
MTKPECKLVESEGNIFTLIGNAYHSLKCAGFHNEAKEMMNAIRSEDSTSTQKLQIIRNYVNVV